MDPDDMMYAVFMSMLIGAFILGFFFGRGLIHARMPTWMCRRCLGQGTGSSGWCHKCNGSGNR